jgi:hypothetical protein
MDDRYRAIIAQAGREYTIADVDDLLTKAGLKPRLPSPEACQRAAVVLTASAALQQSYEKNKAALAPMIAVKEALVRSRAAIARLNDSAPIKADLARDVERILANYPKQAVSILSSHRRHYTGAAELLLWSYLRLVGLPAARHKNSPAMRYVAAALNLTGWRASAGRELTAAAVAQALRR